MFIEKYIALFLNFIMFCLCLTFHYISIHETLTGATSPAIKMWANAHKFVVKFRISRFVLN